MIEQNVERALELADRVCVLVRGAVSVERDAADVTVDEVGAIFLERGTLAGGPAMTAFDAGVIGRVFTGDPIVVSREQIAAYAAATNEQAGPALQGALAPPAFAFTALRPPLRRALAAATPLYGQLKGVHGEHDLRVLAPIEPGMELTPSVEVVGLRQRVRPGSRSWRTRARRRPMTGR